jgi:hypothetical protein
MRTLACVLLLNVHHTMKLVLLLALLLPPGLHCSSAMHRSHELVVVLLQPPLAAQAPAVSR